MGRRKIEIRAIKDDRNRSVTFLKRKGGLFKKAHELSVLCSVDVAVIIFGQNKKLYEFSSGDIHQHIQRHQYYGQPHEHKGPRDFTDKNAGGDDDDDDNMPQSPQPHDQTPPQGMQHHPLHAQSNLQHMRDRSTPSASQSPPMPNGSFQPHRLSTPQPPNISRPGSRTHIRRTSSNLVPQHHVQPQVAQQQQMMNHGQQMQQGYGQQHAPFYQHQGNAVHVQQQQQQQLQRSPPMAHQQHFNTHPPPNAHMQQLFINDQQHRNSLPPHMQAHAQEGAMAQMHASPPPSRPFQSPPLPGQPSQHPHGTHAPQQWQPPPMGALHMRNEHQMEDVGPARPQSIDVGAAMRYNADQQGDGGRYGPPPQPPPSAPLHAPLRTASTGGATAGLGRVNSMASDAKRPQLRVTIPGEEPDSEAGESSSPKDTNKTNTTTPAKPGASETSHSSGLVLPAPSPRSASAGAILSAGATGPTNPFARPVIPKKDASNSEWKDGIASPMSALPSRVMAESGYMSSPSSMFPDLGFGSVHGNTLASPAVYQPTPVNYHGPSFRDDPGEKKEEKRQRSVDDAEAAPNKKTKS